MLDLIRVQDLDGITVSDSYNATCYVGVGYGGRKQKGQDGALQYLHGVPRTIFISS
jgi:hypothetical protein